MGKSKTALGVKKKTIDPQLDALFSTSAGPVTRPARARYSGASNPVPTQKKTDAEPAASFDTIPSIPSREKLSPDAGIEVYSEADVEDELESAAEQSDEEEVTSEDEQPAVKKARKRKRKADGEDLEDKYLAKLAQEEELERSKAKKRKLGAAQGEDLERTSSGEESDQEPEGEPPLHESLINKPDDSEIDKANRTVFLSNVSIEALWSSSAKKTLVTHISSVLDKDASPPQKLESIRFRSIPFSTASMPKRAAFITNAVMEATTRSVNAYAVYSDAAAARRASAELSGSVVLGRHLLVDHVAHPKPTDHRRCVFVGNLGFVDDETVISTNAEGDTKAKKRHKVPADVEEGLWRTFGSDDRRVEKVRVVRDPKTRVGKGFAYVQFYDGNDVESALLLDGKKFAPMLPRPLRVTRAKDPKKTALAREKSLKKMNGKGPAKGGSAASQEHQSMSGRAGKLLGRSGAAKQKHGQSRQKGARPSLPGNFKSPEDIVFEGKRASEKDGIPAGLKGKKFKGKKGSKRPHGKRAARAAAWKKQTPS